MDDRMTPELLQSLLDEHAAVLELFASQWADSPEDCVQEAYVELVRQRHLPDRIGCWLFRVVRNRAISQRRASQRRQRYESAAAHERAAWFQPAANVLVDAETLTDALRGLEAELREVVVAKIWGDLTYEEIAEVVGVSKSSVHRRYEAGLSKLRERLGLTWLNKNQTPNSMNSNAS